MRTARSKPHSIPATMRAFAIDKFDEEGSLREVPTPEIGPDEMLVRVRAAGVNPLDLKIRDGGKAASDVRFPFILGQDAAGVVERVGARVIRFGLDSEVYGAFWFAGAFAEYVRVSMTAAVAYKPATIDFTHAAALPTPGLAAAAALRALALQPGETVLIVGATGGVGSYAVQMAARCGARVIATAQPNAEGYIRKLGASDVIDYTRSDLVAAVRASHSEGIDAVVDLVSNPPTLQRLADALRHGGRLVSSVHAADEAAFAARGIRAANIDVLEVTEGLDEVARFVDQGGMSVPLERTYPLEAAADALAALRAEHTRGKIERSF